MAQTRKKRRRKHRGTQAGTIERPGRTGRPANQPKAKGSKATKGSASNPRSREAAREEAQRRRQERAEREPTWRSALNRALFAAGILALFIAVVQKNVAQGIVMGALAVIIYLPMSYYTDRALWRRRMRQKQQHR